MPMTVLVNVNTDFSNNNTLNDVDLIDFTNLLFSTVTATFASSQFNGTVIRDTVSFSGSPGTNNLVVRGGSLNASGWLNVSELSSILLEGTDATNDTIIGTTAVDTINGLNGNDTIRGGAGADVLDGGLGTDIVDYTGSNAAVNINLETNAVSGGHAASDLISNFEGAIGSSHGDTLQARTNIASTLRGGGGLDTLVGGNASDTFEYTSTTDVVAGENVTGGGGTDTLLFSGTGLFDVSGFNIVTIDKLQFSSALAVALHQSDIGTGAILQVEGSAGANEIRVNGNAIDLSGVLSFASWTALEDAILLTGTVGADTIVGSSQNDTISGGAGADSMTGGAGSDLYLVESAANLAGDSFIDLSNAGSPDKIRATGVGIYDFSVLTVTNVDIFEFGIGGITAQFAGAQVGSTFNLLNQIAGSAGTDSLVVSGANASVAGLGFANWSNGTDTVTVSGNGSLSGNNVTDDTINGSAGTDTLNGLGGRDILNGNGGTDTFFGGAGDDTINGGAGVDTMSGQGDDDTINGFAGNDEIQGGTGNDVIDGGTDDDEIFGEDGDDTITGGSGVDSMLGGSGADIFIVNAGAELASGEIINGQDADVGVDRIQLNGVGAFDFTGVVITGIDEFRFGASATSATFTSSQISANHTDAPGLELVIRGSSANNQLVINLDNQNLNMSGVQFLGWNSAVDTVTINGTAASGDVIIGSSVAETVNAGNGNDAIVLSLGSDILNGDGGNDTFSVSDQSFLETGLQVNGGSGVTDKIQLNGNAQAYDFSGVSISGIEVLTLNLGGTVTINGSMVGGSAISLIEAGSGGVETVNIFGSNIVLTDVTFNMALTDNLNLNGTSGADTLDARYIGNFSPGAAINGFGGSDAINGTVQSDTIDGGDGNDTITGGFGADAMSGGTGNDTFVIVDTADVIGDQFDGGDDIDSIEIRTSAQQNLAGLAITSIERLVFGTGAIKIQASGSVFGPAGITSVTGNANVNELETFGSTNYAGVGFIGWTSGVDSVLMQGLGSDAESFVGANVADTINAGAGIDTITSSLGSDTINAGDGNDRVTYLLGNHFSAAESLNGDTGLDTLVVAGNGTFDFTLGSVSGFEVLEFSNTGTATARLSSDDFGSSNIVSVIGSAGANHLIVEGSSVSLFSVVFTNWNPASDTITINGTSSVDFLTGSGQKETINGGDENDTVVISAGGDTLNGDAGNDDFSLDSSAGISIVGLQVNGGDGVDKLTLGNNSGIVDLLAMSATSIERLVLGGSGNAFTARINGALLADALSIEDSNANVTLEIEGSIDLSAATTNFGGGDSFTFNGTSGDDTIFGVGVGLINFSTATMNGLGGNDILTGGIMNETIDGGDGSDTLSGGGGINTLRGGVGNDRFIAGTGEDSFDGGTGLHDLVDYSATSLSLILSLLSQTSSQSGLVDTLVNIEDIIGTNLGDQITGDVFDNIVTGGDGADVLNGGLGNDTASYANSASAVNANLGTGTAAGVDQGAGDTLIDFENLIGSTFADILAGNLLANVLAGGAGNDTIRGGLNDDNLDGGVNNDTLRGEGDDDTLNGDAGDDDLFGGSGNDIINGGADNDTLEGQGNNDTLNGDDGNDVVRGAAGIDILSGGGGDDNLNGGAGGDTLDGGTGNDIMTGTIDNVRDTFIFRDGYDLDRINSFEQTGNDRLQLDDDLWFATHGVLTAAQVVTTFGSINGSNTVITLDFGAGDILEVLNGAGLNLGTLSTDVFIF